MNKEIIVSVIVPCYNQSSYIIECLISVENQSYKNWECIIVDDGSTDQSKEIIKQFIKNKTEFRLISKKNGGVASARNLGILNSKGTYILPLDGDDKIGEDYLKFAVNHFEKFPKTSLVYCNARYFGKKNKIMKLPEYKYNSFLSKNCIFCTAMYKKIDFDTKTNGYDVKMVEGLEDWEFWIQLLDEKSIVHKLDKELFFYRRTGNSRNKNINNKRIRKKLMNYIHNKHPELFKKKSKTKNIYKYLIKSIFGK